MEYTALGQTGLHVSKVALGTATFGLENYGIRAPDEPLLKTKPLPECIKFFDTARGYLQVLVNEVSQLIAFTKPSRVQKSLPLPDHRRMLWA
jgi:aryl-alcohol dehydrogenase-like predicted oxidoreductase